MSDGNKDKPHWDEDSPELRKNLDQVLHDVRDDSFRRVKPTVEAVRAWHRTIMDGLSVPRPERVGRFRGEPGLEGYGVKVGDDYGVFSDQVAEELRAFEETLQKAVDILDRRINPIEDLNDYDDISDDDVNEVIDLCAWVHSEWVRIHPFANGNGRTARLWVNFLAMRYGLPPFARPRPRPDDGYEAAAHAAMKGQWEPTVRVFHQMYRNHIRP